MAEPLREQAIVEIVDAIEALTGTRPWGGVYPNAPVVERAFKEPAQVSRFPHFMVLEVDGSQAVLRTMSGGGGDYEHALEIEIGCYVTATGGVSASTWKQRTWDDVFKAIKKLPNRGRDIEPTGYRTDQGEFGPIGIWWQGYRILLSESVEVA